MKYNLIISKQKNEVGNGSVSRDSSGAVVAATCEKLQYKTCCIIALLSSSDKYLAEIGDILEDIRSLVVSPPHCKK